MPRLPSFAAVLFFVMLCYGDPAAANRLIRRGCDDVYIVREGETLQTIGDRCDDPFIVERNPHINDPDDVFPGLVIRISTVSNL